MHGFLRERWTRETPVGGSGKQLCSVSPLLGFCLRGLGIPLFHDSYFFIYLLFLQ